MSQQRAAAMADALLHTMRLAPFGEDITPGTQERRDWLAVLTLLQRAKVRLNSMRISP